MIEIKKHREPQALTEYRKDPTATYQNMHGAPTGRVDSEGKKIDVYRVVLKSLMEEQGYLCAYCMRRIPERHGKIRASIEHIDPQSKTDRLKALDYSNMLAVCSGNRDAGTKDAKTCDAHRGNDKLSINLTRKSTLSQIDYRSNGRIFSDDEPINAQLNETLNLNCKARDLIALRKSALNRMQVMIKKKNREGDRAFYGKILNLYLQDISPKEEYVGILINWLEKHLTS